MLALLGMQEGEMYYGASEKSHYRALCKRVT